MRTILLKILFLSLGVVITTGCTNVKNISSSALKGIFDGSSNSPKDSSLDAGAGDIAKDTTTNYTVNGSFGTFTTQVQTSSGYTVEGSFTNE